MSDLVRRDRAVVWHPYTQQGIEADPLPVRSAHGATLVLEDGRLYLIPRRWACLGIPLPMALLPVGTSFEHERDGRFGFDVEIGAPLIGLIVAYKGELDPV